MLKHLQSREDWSEKNLGAKGFTLIELLVVIIILGILAAVAIFAVGSINDRAKTNACKNEKDTLATAVEAFNAQAERYPTSISELTSSTTVGSETVKATLKSDPSYWTLSGTGGNIARTAKQADNCS